MAAADEVARENNWNVAISIVDVRGHIVMYQKFDNTLFVSTDVATGKALTALGFRRPTKSLEDAISESGNGFRYLGVEGITPLQGGWPIVIDHKVVGAIGVSGVASANDELIAEAAVAAITGE